MRSVSVDVIVPAYNAAPFIRNALDSIARQTLQPNRVIVVDDGSTDATSEIVEAFSAVHPMLNLTYVRQLNSGPSAARNAGIKLSTSDFIALLDADDIWVDTKLERQAGLFARGGSEGLGLVYCDYGIVDQDARPLESASRISPRLRGNAEHALKSGNLISGSASAVLLRVSALKQVGLFDEALVCAEDWDLWLRIARHWQIDFVPEQLVLLRQHAKSAQRDELRMLGGELRFAEKLLQRSQLGVIHWLRLLARMQRLKRSLSDYSPPWVPGYLTKVLFARPWVCCVGFFVNLLRRTSGP